jgi:hypothetical protein
MLNIGSKSKTENGFNENDLVCYCFGYRKKDIENDFYKNDRSLIYEKLAFEKKAGRCNCASKNPKGT